MKSCWIRHGHRRLLVLALGWGQTCDSWQSKEFGDVDVLILYQWDSPEALPALSGYESYVLVSWSFGVWAASQLDFGISFQRALAVNGTLFPIDDQRGIPPSIFALTLSGWQEGRSGRSFWKRMGSSRLPDRDDGALLAELRFFAHWFEEPETKHGLHYDLAIVGTRDRIFPAAHQRQAWQNIPVCELDMPHDMEANWPEILKMTTDPSVDKNLVSKRFERSASTYDAHAVVQREMAERLVEALSKTTYERALEFGCGTGVFTGLLRPLCGRLYRNDLVPGSGEDYLCGDIERLDLPNPLNLIAGNAVWQWLADPRRMVRRMHQALVTEGVVALSSFAPGTMGELAKVLGISLSYQDKADFLAMFQDRFDILHFQEYERVLTFDTPLEVLRHLKHTGVTAVGGQFRWTRGKLAEFDQQYRFHFPQVTLTYRPRLLLARKN